MRRLSSCVFHRRGTSITSSFAGPHGDDTYAGTPPAGFHPALPPVPLEYHASVSQKLDQLLFLYLEEKKEISDLKDAVSSLTEKVGKVMERQEETDAKQKQMAEGKRSYKILSDVSVSNLMTATPPFINHFTVSREAVA